MVDRPFFWLNKGSNNENNADLVWMCFRARY
ncbi:hypothetical protein SKA34_10880 [Photobacterium sp. SKA34]|nr:hypothetical protein SKA34_10880 [Photobacterium sp. SKA34]